MDPMTVLAGAEAVANPLMAHLTNVKNRKFTREMYKTQRADALADWDRQNRYNSPREIMQRFQEAGLNPNLIYGQMQEASPIRNTSSSGGQATAPQAEGSKNLAYVRQSGAQTDILQQQKKLMDAEIRNKDASTIATIANSELTEIQKQAALFDLGLKTELRTTTIAGAQAGLQKTIADTTFTIDQNKRSAELHPGNLTEQQVRIKKDLLGIAVNEAQQAKTLAEIREINQKVLLLQKENIIKAFDVDLTKKGIRPGDPVYTRWAKEFFNEALEGLKGEAKQIGEILKTGKNPNSKPFPKKSYHKFGEYSATDSQ